ncbi:MAG: RhuM family protein [Actinomycetes bacterium]
MSEQAPGEIVLYSREDGAPAIEVHLEADTVWLTQQQLAALFQTSRTNVVEHIQHIYEEGELEQDATCRDFRQVDAAEFRAQSHEPTYMKDWLAHLDRLIAAMEAQTLNGPGSTSHQQAMEKAEGEYEKYRALADSPPSDVERAYLDAVKRAQHRLEEGESS